MTFRVLTLSTLFPDMARPNFGIFVERQTRELAARDAVEVTVMTPIGLPPFPFDRHNRYAALRHLPIRESWRDLTVWRPRFVILPKLGGALHVASMSRAILPLVKRLHRETPFDVIDASFFYPDGPVARRLSRALGIPYSVKARGADIHLWGRRRDTRRAVLTAGRDAAGLLAVSGAMKRSMVALGMAADKITVHYTGVDLDRFVIADRQAAKAEIGINTPIILSVGALIPRKGQALLIEALAALPSHLANATLLLAGQGPDRSRLEALATRLGAASRVGFLGSVPHDRLPLLYAAADVMALPSSSEGLANAWVEALACGTPVITCDVGGARELIERPAAGRIVERTAEAIGEAVRELLAAPPERHAVRATALRFTWDANAAALEAHLRGCAAVRP